MSFINWGAFLAMFAAATHRPAACFSGDYMLHHTADFADIKYRLRSRPRTWASRAEASNGSWTIVTHRDRSAKRKRIDRLLFRRTPFPQNMDGQRISFALHAVGVSVTTQKRRVTSTAGGRNRRRWKDNVKPALHIELHDKLDTRLRDGALIAVKDAISLLVGETELKKSYTKMSNDNTTANSGCARDPQWEEQVRQGIDDALQICAKRGLSTEAMKIVGEHLPALGIGVSLEQWLLALDACSGEGEADSLVAVLQKMRSSGQNLTRSITEAAFEACIRDSNAELSAVVLGEALASRIYVDAERVAGLMRAALFSGGDGWTNAAALYDKVAKAAVVNAESRESAGDIRVARGATVTNTEQSLLVGPGWDDVHTLCIEAYCKGDRLAEALKIIEVLRSRTDKRNEDFLEMAIEACGRGGAWDLVSQLAAEARPDEKSLTTASFTTALQGCGITGRWKPAVELLRSMAGVKTDGPRITNDHYMIALRACAAATDEPGSNGAREAARAALELLDHFSQKRSTSKETVQEATQYAMDACSRARDVKGIMSLLADAAARRVPASLSLRIAAMKACGVANDWRSVLDIFGGLERDRLKPGAKVYMAALKACAITGDSDRALDLLKKVMEYHGDRKKIVHAAFDSALVSCAKSASWRTTLIIMNEMHHDKRVRVSSRKLNKALAVCCRAGRPDEALAMLNMMTTKREEEQDEEDGDDDDDEVLQPDGKSYIYLLQGYLSARRFEVAVALLETMQTIGGVTPTSLHFECVAESFSENGKSKQAIALLEDMEARGYKPSQYMLRHCAIACEVDGERERLIELWQYIKLRKDVRPDRRTFSLIMRAYANAGRVDDVLGLLKIQEKSFGISPNTDSYLVAIVSLASARRWDEAIEQLDVMSSRGFEIREPTIAALLEICARDRDVETALDLFERIKAYGAQVQRVTYAAMVALACRVGDRDMAKRFLEEMTTQQHPPTDQDLYSAAMACRDVINVGGMEDLMLYRRQEKLPPDRTIAEYAVQTYFRAENLIGGLDIIRQMKAQGLEPCPSFYTNVMSGLAYSYTKNQ